jgi:hypothetical protein
MQLLLASSRAFGRERSPARAGSEGSARRAGSRPALTISHVDQGDERFAFVLSLVHPLFGEISRQTGIFRKRPAADAGCSVIKPAAPPSPAPAASSPAG